MDGGKEEEEKQVRLEVKSRRVGGLDGSEGRGGE